MTVSNKINRRPFVAALLAQRGNALVVPGLGSRPGTAPPPATARSISIHGAAWGLRCRRRSALRWRVQSGVFWPDRGWRDADGIGSLGVVGAQGAKNLSILVLDNESFGETGRQTGLTSDATDLCAIARGFGIARTMHVTEQDKADELAAFLFKGDGPCFAVAKIGLSEDPWSLPIKDGAAIARRMRVALGIETA